MKEELTTPIVLELLHLHIDATSMVPYLRFKMNWWVFVMRESWSQSWMIHLLTWVDKNINELQGKGPHYVLTRPNIAEHPLNEGRLAFVNLLDFPPNLNQNS